MACIWRCAPIAALYIFLCLFPTTGQAAKVSCLSTDHGLTASSCTSLWISGEIESGDSAKLMKHLSDESPKKPKVFLSSRGGDVRAAMEIGRIIRKQGLKVIAPTMDSCGLGVLTVNSSGKKLCEGNDCVCASACFLLWVAGTDAREGNKIGIHRPSPSFAGDPIGRAVAIYKKITLRPHLLGIISEVRAYLAEMQVPDKFIDLMTRTASHDIYWLDADEAASLHKPYGISRPQNNFPAFRLP